MAKKATRGGRSSKSSSTPSRSRQRDKARASGAVGGQAAFEELLLKNVSGYQKSLQKNKSLPDDSYVGLLGDVQASVSKSIPMVRINLHTVLGTESVNEFEGVPVTLFYRLLNPTDPENNWGLDSLLRDLMSLGVDEVMLDDPTKLPKILQTLQDSTDMYVRFTAKTKTAESGQVFTNYFINGLADAEALGLE